LERGHSREVLYGSSFLPRAAISSVALQRPVPSEELEGASEAFRAVRATKDEISNYAARHVCSAARAGRNSFCSGGKGTFIL
jgi:hypothetical protein